MTTLNNRNCPLSEEFFYWPPEEIAQYNNWCEVIHTEDNSPLKSPLHEDKLNKHKI